MVFARRAGPPEGPSGSRVSATRQGTTVKRLVPEGPADGVGVLVGVCVAVLVGVVVGVFVGGPVGVFVGVCVGVNVRV